MSTDVVARTVPLAREPLPRYVSGSRSIGWWGIFLLIVIESVVIGSLIFSYFYLKASSASWPQGGISPPDLLLPSLNALILVASAAPIWWSERSARRGDRNGIVLGLGVGIALALVFLALKVVEYSGQSYTWRTNAYGSIVWTITGFHSIHVLAMLLKSAAIAVVAWQGYFDARRHVAVQGNALYWYFVVAAWAPLFATLYLSPRMF